MKSTKFLFGAGLFVAFAFIVALFMIGFLNLQPQKVNSSIGGTGSGSSSGTSSNPSSGSSGSQSVVLNAQEVAKHSTSSDCWTIVNGKVYDLTSFASSHSGGSQEILRDCGKDGSSGFNTKYGNGKHASGDTSILMNYYLGDLNQNISVSEVQNKTVAIANIPPQGGGDDDNDDDD
ncbi:MAG: cytochrome b5-like heme/steroid binding domain-containing protein [archaeon]